MKKQILSIIIGTIVLAFLFGTLQAQTVTLTFTGKDANNQYVQLNRVAITNLTKGWQETIYWPDTTLTMQNGTGIDESVANSGFGLSQNNPNPFTVTTDVNLTVADAGAVTLEIVDVYGRIAVETTHALSLQPGTHQFRISLSAAGTYVMTARQNGKTSSTKMVCNGAGNANAIEYAGEIVKTTHALSPQPKSTTNNPFNFGDQMEYVGYATINDTECESGRITQSQSGSQSFALQFDEAHPQPQQLGQPCPGSETVTDVDGNVYNTVQLGNQCWMKENLRTTRYADNTPISQGSSVSTTTAYWYYPNNDASIKSIYGLLYNLAAVMHGAASSVANPSGVQGICPDGWHVPSDAEWTQLTDYVGSQSEYVCGSNNAYIAKALAATTGWYWYDWVDDEDECAVGYDQSANNATGFSALPAGGYGNGGGSYGSYCFRTEAFFWTTTSYGVPCCRFLESYYDVVTTNDYPSFEGLSVRCLRD
ncbi:MAG: T9SS type A sorting domain-containing protein [Bacteroidales bacterium]|nr:T9SS type A sorting domain-containing protein [Bacteroidales bacterium]